MAYYISTIRGIEILMMVAEFSKDENGYVWFYYAQEIYIRDVPNKKTLNSKDAKREAKKIAENKEKVRQTMIQELQQYEAQQRNQKNRATEKMLDFMNSYYKEMKSEIGMDDNAKHNDDDNNLDDILRTLKQNTTAENFKEFLSIKDNCNRTQAWRAISRKIYKRDQQNNKTLSPVVADCDPHNMQVAQLFSAFQTNFRKANQPLLEEPKQLKLLNQLIQKQPDQHPSEVLKSYPQGPAHEHQYQPKEAAHVKAELIRRNLLSRKDLMQLYRPPLKKSQIPQNNPFTNRSMVEPR